MSAETKAALAAAIRAHVVDETGESDLIITSYAAVSVGILPVDFGEGRARYDLHFPAGAPFHDTLGLLHWAVHWMHED